MGEAATKDDANTTLTELVAREGRLDLPRTLRIGHHIARSLRVAHAQGLVHGALTPDRVVRVGGRWEVTGYGETSSCARDHAYLSPDSWRAHQASAHGDIWALGAILFELLTGTLPFPHLAPFDPSRCLIINTPPPVSQLCVVPMSVETLVAQCLATSPHQRPSASRVVEALYRSRKQAARGANAVVVASGNASSLPQAVVAVPPKGGRPRLPSGLGVHLAVLFTGFVLGMLLHGQLISTLCRAIVM